MRENRKVVVLTKNGARVLGLLFWMGVALPSSRESSKM